VPGPPVLPVGVGADRGRVIVVRHGETEWSRSGRHTGRTDVPLDPSGVEQATAVGRCLAEVRPVLVLSSPLARALDTCRLAGFGDRVETTDDLLEWDYGDYEGRTTDDIRRERPGWTLWTDGVPSGESAADVGRRVDRVIAQAWSVEGDTLCVAHGHVLRVMAARWVGLPPVGGRLWALDAGSLGVLGWERETPVTSRWNLPSPARVR
jgi:broad specificity phosphatase PhoE